MVQRHFQHIQRFPWVRQCWSQLVGRVSESLLHHEGDPKASMQEVWEGCVSGCGDGHRFCDGLFNSLVRKVGLLTW